MGLAPLPWHMPTAASRTLFALVVIASSLASPASAAVDPTAALVCRHAKLLRQDSAPARTLRPAIAVEENGEQQTLRLGRTRTICLPAVDQGDAPALTAALAAWEVRQRHGTTLPGDRSGETIDLETRFGSVDARLSSLTRALVTASAAPGTGGAPPLTASGVELLCHGLRTTGAGPGRLVLTTAFGTHDLRIERPRRFCDAASLPDYVCHRARTQRGSAAPRGDLVSITTTFGPAVLRLGPVAEVCVPTVRGTEPPPFALRVEPADQHVEWHQTADVRAFADYPDGHSEEITAQVAWSAGDATIAGLLDDAPVPGRFVGREPGSTTIVATDPTTGAQGEAMLTVDWTLQRIDVQPKQLNRVVGESQSFTAIGTFASGATLNVTGRVAWSTGDQAVATAAAPGAPSPSRITAVGFGTTTVSACDPLTGICSSDDGGDASLVVQGGLQYIEIRPSTERSVLPGGAIRFTAIGHYADGRTKNLTQQVEWQSSAPAVARADNTAGDRSRIDGVTPGITTIRARDPQTGFQAFGVTLFVLGDLYRLAIYPYDSRGDAVRAPGSRRFTAIGEYVGGGYRNLTQDVVWHSRDPQIGTAPNAANDRSRIDSAGSPGQARIWAEDPTTGIASDDAIFRVLGDLTALDVRTDTRRPAPFNRVPVGGMIPLFVSGTFSTGERLNFARFFPGGYTIVSSDPSLAEVVDGDAVRGVASGVVQLRAIDTASGFEGAPFEVLVQGALERLEVHPFVTVLPVGASTSVQIFGHFTPGIRLPFFGPLTATSSDEGIAVVGPGPRNFRLVTGTGPGTATIAVTDPATGVSSTDTGDDATITFFPGGPPVSVAVTPPVSTLPVDGFDDFTAVATYANGQTLNVTQLAFWESSAPAVAEVVGLRPTGLSRTIGRSAGVANISATYRGVSSTSSGQDGIAVVSDALGLTVLGTADPLAVGASRELRATALLASGRVLNVTKMLEWRSLDAGIAEFFDDEAPNTVTGLAAGVVDLDVGLPGSAVRTTVQLTVIDEPITTTTTTTSVSTTTTTTIAVLPLRIVPAAQTVDFGQTARYRAIRGSADVSDAVTWAVDDAAVASGDGGALTATDPGTTAVRVLDPGTGDVAAASLDVEWSLRSVALWPRQANRAVGDWERFTALGTFRRGGTAVITDRLRYAVADPTVAALQSGVDTPSEVMALREGRTTISACDPLTHVCSESTGGNALLLVGGGLQAITVTPGATVTHFAGESEQYTAIGHFADGSTQDLTTTVTWAVSDAAVARASNVDGTRGRVYALSPGNADVTATDPETGITSTGLHWFTTLGGLQSIVVSPTGYLEAGTSAHLRAFGIFEGGTRDFSELVTWETDDAQVVAATNPPGDRNRVDAVTPGTTVARARLASAGLVSNDVPLSVFGGITSLALNLRSATRLGIGGQLDVSVTGTFDAPGFFYAESLTRTGRAYDLVSDDPAILEVVDQRTIRGVSGGIAHLTATDPVSGVTSPPVTITVQGVLERITLSPAGIVRALGEKQSFTATGHYTPALTGLLTQQVEWHSSDESVAIALNTLGNRSQVVMVGPGTATISATDPVTGISSTDSGGDVTVTVRPGMLDRIVVSPPFVRRTTLQDEEFTATGYYPDGSSINVTQQVEWTTSDSSVAGAFGPPNRRSLFQATGPGVAVIGAVHPQGVRSSDSGHDAIMEVDQVVSLQMTPAQRFLAPGQSAQFTVRATMASGAVVNVTQDASYFTASPVLSVPDAPPRRSEVVAVAPGQGKVFASYGFRGAAATVTVVGSSPSGAFLD